MDGISFDTLRWFDYWLKGIENKIMEEPLITFFITGTRKWRTGTEWPLPETRWAPLYLHLKGVLSDRESCPNEGIRTLEDSLFYRRNPDFPFAGWASP